MAKKKKTARRTTHRRRRVGGASKDMMETLMWLAIGGVAARVTKSLVKNVKILDNVKTDADIKAALPMAVGVGVALFMGKKDKNMLMLGGGMVAQGAADLANTLGLIGLINDARPMVAGRARRTMINGNTTQHRQIAGVNSRNAFLATQI